MDFLKSMVNPLLPESMKEKKDEGTTEKKDESAPPAEGTAPQEGAPVSEPAAEAAPPAPEGQPTAETAAPAQEAAQPAAEGTQPAQEPAAPAGTEQTAAPVAEPAPAAEPTQPAASVETAPAQPTQPTAEPAPAAPATEPAPAAPAEAPATEPALVAPVAAVAEPAPATEAPAPVSAPEVVPETVAPAEAAPPAPAVEQPAAAETQAAPAEPQQAVTVVPAPESQPVVAPSEPAPAPVVQPAPVPAPQPVPAVQPTPAPQPVQVVQPVPAPQPQPVQVVPQPVQQPVQAVPQPFVQQPVPVQQPVEEFIQAPVSATQLGVVPGSQPQRVFQPKPKPVRIIQQDHGQARIPKRLYIDTPDFNPHLPYQAPYQASPYRSHPAPGRLNMNPGKFGGSEPLPEPGAVYVANPNKPRGRQQPQPQPQPEEPTFNPYAGTDSPLANMGLEIYKRWLKRFNAIDLNKDGFISLREMATIGKVLGYQLSVEELCEIFHKRDIDDSGGISFEEFVKGMMENVERRKALQPIRQKFREFDYRGRGYITAEDAYPVLQRDLGFDLNKTESFIDLFDKNRDYRLTIGEFAAFHNRYKELKTQVETAFYEFDQDHDGFITFEEARNVMLTKGFTEEQVYEYFVRYDEDGDGRLNFTEFAKFWDIPIF